jgi:hypothetical protein
MKRVLIAAVILALFGCSKPGATQAEFTNLPTELSDCKFYWLSDSGGVQALIGRCPNSTTSVQATPKGSVPGDNTKLAPNIITEIAPVIAPASAVAAVSEVQAASSVEAASSVQAASAVAAPTPFKPGVKTLPKPFWRILPPQPKIVPSPNVNPLG